MPHRPLSPGAPMVHPTLALPAFLAGLLCGACQPAPTVPADRTIPHPAIRDAATPPSTRHYPVGRRPGPLVVDGNLDETAWQSVPWADGFLDIEGEEHPAPRHGTRVRMLWDDEFWYLAVEMEEPDLWATIQTRDSVIFLDNDFEWFVDPDGDTHRYFEFEVNALGTEWDLFLPKPYRDGGQADNSWNIARLRTAVRLHGTLNDPSDRDQGWTLEMAVPWTAFADSGRTPVPPVIGDRWRLNFSRVQWDLEVVDGAYRKRTDPATGSPVAEHNWVWSPQGAINMHMPEMWGTMVFVEDPAPPLSTAPSEPDAGVRWALRRVYYAQRTFHREHGRWAAQLAELAVRGLPPDLTLQVTADGWQATALARGGTLAIRSDGLVWTP